jgi:Helix-turn-helix domain
MSNANHIGFTNLLDQADKQVTLRDLSNFKSQLLQDIRLLLTGNSVKGETKKWMKSLEVQKLLNISRGKLLTLRLSGKLPFTKIGGIIYYNQEDINNMFEANKSH